MSGYMKVATVLSGMLLMFVAAGCCFPLKEKPAVEVPAPVVETPPAEPKFVEPPPAPAPQPPPPVLPPAVTKSIEELSDKYPGLFKFDKDKGLLRFNSDAMFDTGSSVVKPDSKVALGKLAKILNEEGANDRKLTIIGYTDSDRVVKSATIGFLKKLGKSVDNMGLSEARSEAVAAVLQAGGVDASRMITQGKGDAEPVADNRTAEGKARNRRVEIYVTPAKSGG
jgi:OmpA-OmpF porin, OOP family